MRTALLTLLLASVPAIAAEAPPGLAACRLAGVEHGAWCGSVKRPLDPAQPGGPAIDVHFAVLPAVARNKKPDPVFFFAGGPGQSAIALAPQVARLLARFSNRRDIVLVDQRGTGRSAPLVCDDVAATRPLREATDPARQFAELVACRQRLAALPHGDLRQYTTSIAMQDVDAVRAVLGAAQVNAVGASYGTRAVLEYQRQFPQRVRRAVIDGVAPPDMGMPQTFAADAQAAFDALFAACDAEAACAKRHPALRARWQALLAGLPREVTVRHPFTGADERLTLTREIVAGLVRGPLYAPAQAAALPQAIDDAAAGRFEALFALGTALGGSRGLSIAAGMHFSVVCTEDPPRADAVQAGAAGDFGDHFAGLYRRICADWPRGQVEPAFYRVPPAPAPVLVLSGGLDPVTPPRHGERVAQALGAKARHVVVANAGHGVMALGCLRDALYRFVDAASAEQALATELRCAAAVPRPPAFVPVEARP